MTDEYMKLGPVMVKEGDIRNTDNVGSCLEEVLTLSGLSKSKRTRVFMGLGEYKIRM